jgi:hypothetical protein
MGLLQVHEQMLKAAEEKAAQAQIVEERVRILEKYASVAQSLMNEAFPNNHTEADVIELVDGLIQHDLQIEEQQQKVAELEEAGRIMARGFMAETNKTK